ncbi:uncharacterized protein AB9W97_004197 isoform 2-T2 [Spinachia spinachia]
MTASQKTWRISVSMESAAFHPSSIKKKPISPNKRQIPDQGRMFRRSRFSARPNVGATGRTTQEAPSASEEARGTPKDGTAAVTDSPSDKPEAPGDGVEQHGESTGAPAALQRRKRFSIKPKVAPGRPSAVARTQKSPVKAAPEAPVDVPVAGPVKPTTSSQTATAVAPQRLQSPRRQRSSEESKQPKTPTKQTAVPSDSPEPSAEPAEGPPAGGGKELRSTSVSQVEGVPSKLPDTVPFTVMGREAMELSEKAKSLVSSKSGRCLSPLAFSLSRLLNDPSDIQRITKAQKLRDLLKQEMHKEKKRKKGNARVKEYNLDPAKMTMSDLIRYLPESNPMTSSTEESVLGNETVVPPSPAKDASPERSQKLEVIPKIGTPRQVEQELDEEEEDEEDEDDSVMVPQVKVAEDGTLIIDEESLTVEVQRAKGPNPANDRDPIFERGSTTTYASFRKGTYTKPWSSEETDMFFLAVSMVGTDFSMICQLFPLRARSEIKNKFKKEERENSWRVDKAFRERRKLDIEYFSKLLEKILEVQENRKKLRSLSGKKSPQKTRRKAAGKRAARELSILEEEDEEEQDEIADLEEEGEKENEELVNEGGAEVAKPKNKRKRKSKTEALTEEPNDKKNKTDEKSNDRDECCTAGDTEAALPEDCPTSDMSRNTESVSEATEATIRPAKLSRGRAPKPLLPLGRKWGKKPPAPSTKDKGAEGPTDAGAEDQVNKDASTLSQADEEEEASVQPPKPTRYGRLPKPVKPLNYPAKEAASEATAAPPEGSTAPPPPPPAAAKPSSKCTAKRGRPPKLKSSRESKKPKLVTIVASQSDSSDEEGEKPREEDVEEEPPGGAPFVPASLRSLQPVMSQVEETLEELDIFANIPDVLGISQDALCPEVSCERAQHEADTAEPSDHQLDLLVDVIDLFSVDHTEVSEDESYNEAAQTLLTIGNLAHLPQSAQDQTIEDGLTGTTLANVKGNIPHLKDAIASKPALRDENSVAPDRDIIEPSDTVTILHSRKENEDIPVVESSDQRPDSVVDPVPQLLRKTKKGGPSETPKAAEREARVDSRSTCGSTDAALVPHVGTIESVPPDTAVTESQTGHGSNSHSAPGQESGQRPAPCGTAGVGQKDASKVGSTPPPRKSRFQRVKLKLARTSRTKPQTTKASHLHETEPTASVEGSTLTGAEEQSPTDEKRTDAGVRVASGQNASENQELAGAREEPARQQAAGDGKPFEEKPTAAEGRHCDPRATSAPPVAESRGGNGSGADSAPVPESGGPPADVPQTSRTGRSKPRSTEDPVPPVRLGETPPSWTTGPAGNAAATEGATPTCSSGHLEKASQIKSAASVTEPPADLRSSPETTEEMSSTEDRKTAAGRGLKEQSAPQRRQRFTKVKPNLASSPRTARAKRQPPERCHADAPPSETKCPRPPADPIESRQQRLGRNDGEDQSHEGHRPAAPNAESTDSPSRKAPQTLRGRLIRPKPSLGRSGRPPPPRQAAERDSDVCEVRPDVPEPAGGAVGQSPSRNASGSTLCSLTQVTEHPGQPDPPTDGPSPGCLTQAPDSCTQDASTSITAPMTLTNLSILPDLPLEEPRDADEPFFILSLTQIPVTVPGPLPQWPVAEQERPLPAPSHGVVPPVHAGTQKDFLAPQPSSLPMGRPEGPRETGLLRRDADPAACTRGSMVENPAAPDVHPSESAGSVGNDDATPPTRRSGTCHTDTHSSRSLSPSFFIVFPVLLHSVKEQLKPRTAKRRQGEETPKGGDDPEDSGSGAQTARRKGSRNRNPKGSPSVTSETKTTAAPPDAPPGKAASKGPKARTPAKRSPPPAASTSRGAARPPAEARSTFAASATERRKDGPARSVRSPPEVSASRQSDSVEEEPTSVSQYFLRDIFTDVQEG